VDPWRSLPQTPVGRRLSDGRQIRSLRKLPGRIAENNLHAAGLLPALGRIVAPQPGTPCRGRGMRS